MCPGCCSLSKEKYNFSVPQLIHMLNKRVACPIVIVARSRLKRFPHPSSAGFLSVSHDRPPGVTLRMNSEDLGRFTGVQRGFSCLLPTKMTIASAINSRLVYLTSEKL